MTRRALVLTATWAVLSLCLALAQVPHSAAAAVLPRVSVPVAAPYDFGCNPSFPQRMEMYRNGEVVGDLYLCRDWVNNRNQVWNTSKNKVWYFSSPTGLRQWQRSDDVRYPLQVRLFREGLRRVFAARGQVPLMTLEPGTWVSLTAFPFQVRLEQDPYEQVAWRVAATSVTTLRKKAPYAVASVLGFRSPTRKAVLTCVASAYRIYDTLQNDETPANGLATALGLRGDAAQCGKAVDRAAAKAPDRSIVLTTEDLTRTTLRPRWLELTNRWLRVAERTPIARLP